MRKDTHIRNSHRFTWLFMAGYFLTLVACGEGKLTYLDLGNGDPPQDQGTQPHDGDASSVLPLTDGLTAGPDGQAPDTQAPDTQAPDTQPADPCANVSCGSHAHCDQGQCVCDGGYVGDPVAGCSEDNSVVPADFSGVTWLHTNVSGWPQTANLSSVNVSSSTICLNYDKADTWPGLDHVSAFVNANPWIFVFQDGKWYAATWEWMRHGQTCKNRSSVAGDHIKRSPLQDFAPESGRMYGFMVSGLARDSVRNVEERSQVVMIRWP